MVSARQPVDELVADIIGRIPGRLGRSGPAEATPCRMTVRELRVSLGERSYPILIGAGLLGSSDASKRKGARSQWSALFTVGGLYRRDSPVAGRGGGACRCLPTERPTEPKSLDRVFDRLLRERFDRQCLLGPRRRRDRRPDGVRRGGLPPASTSCSAATLLAQVIRRSAARRRSTIRWARTIGAFHQPSWYWPRARCALPRRGLGGTWPDDQARGVADQVSRPARRDLAALRACDAAALVDAVCAPASRPQIVAADERERACAPR